MSVAPAASPASAPAFNPSSYDDNVLATMTPMQKHLFGSSPEQSDPVYVASNPAWGDGWQTLPDSVKDFAGAVQALHGAGSGGEQVVMEHDGTWYANAPSPYTGRTDGITNIFDNGDAAQTRNITIDSGSSGEIFTKSLSTIQYTKQNADLRGVVGDHYVAEFAPDAAIGATVDRAPIQG
jgi:hypothetical protein